MAVTENEEFLLLLPSQKRRRFCFHRCLSACQQDYNSTVNATFHYTIQLASWFASCQRAGQRNGIWPIMRYPARSQQLAGRSVAGPRPAGELQSQTWFPTCYRQVRAISTCRDSSNLVANRFAAGLRPAREPDREPDRELVRELVRELDNVMEFGLNRASWVGRAYRPMAAPAE